MLIIIIASPFLLKVAFVRNIVALIFNDLPNFKNTYFEVVGYITGTAFAITGAVVTQRYFNKKSIELEQKRALILIKEEARRNLDIAKSFRNYLNSNNKTIIELYKGTQKPGDVLSRRFETKSWDNFKGTLLLIDDDRIENKVLEGYYSLTVFNNANQVESGFLDTCSNKINEILQVANELLPKFN